MSDKNVDDDALGDTVCVNEEERFATTNSKGNLNITEKMEANEAFSMNAISEEINQTESTRSQVIPKNTNQNTNQELREDRKDTNATAENVTTETPETCGEVEAIGGSEEILCKPCQPCLESNTEIDSLLYCIECEEYLCEKCVEMHRGVKLSKKHKLVPKETPEEHGKEFKMNKKEECPIHLNEFIEWFCISDDKLSCPICKATEHSRCQSLVAITSVAQTTEIQMIEQEIIETQNLLETAIDRKKMDISSLEEDRNDSLRVLENIKTDTEHTFENLRRSLDKERQKIEGKYMEQNDHLKTDVENYSKIAKNLNTTHEVLQKENISDEYKFIQMKKAEGHLRSVQKTILENTSEALTTPIGYERDKLFDVKVHAFERFGYFDEEKSLYNCSEPRKINILKYGEKETIIFDIFAVGCDNILITDWTNCAVKLVDTNRGTIKHKLEMPSGPFGICKLEQDGTYAITLTYRQQVSIIEVTNYDVCMKKKSFLKTGENCRGIAYCNLKLFVACGGLVAQKEGPGHIRIFNTEGNLLETLTSDTSGLVVISFPCKIAFLPEAIIAFIADGTGLIKLDASDKGISIKKALKNIQVSSCYGSLSFDLTGRVVIAEPDSKSVKLLSKDYSRTELLVTGLPQAPTSIAFETSSLQLFVGLQKSKDLICFQLEKNNWNKPPTFG